jgi:hypothetical protein
MFGNAVRRDLALVEEREAGGRLDAKRMPLNAISHRICTTLGGRGRLAGHVAAVVAPLLLVQIAAAQQSAPPAEPNPPQVHSTSQSPGLFESIGRWFDQGTAGFRSHVLGAQESFNDLNQRAAATSKNISNTAVEAGKNAIGAGVTAADATKDALGVVAKLPTTRVVRGRERCQQAPNGAPDCVAAAEALCRKQGYSTGKSLDFTSAEHCPPKVMLSSRQAEDECITVTFISRAMCQ